MHPQERHSFPMRNCAGMLPGMDDCRDDMVHADTVFHLGKHEWPLRAFFLSRSIACKSARPAARTIVLLLTRLEDLWKMYVACAMLFFQAEDGIRDTSVTGVDVCSSDLTTLTGVLIGTMSPPEGVWEITFPTG